MEIIKQIASLATTRVCYSLAALLTRNRPNGWEKIAIGELQNFEIGTGVGPRNPKFAVEGVARIFDVQEHRAGGTWVTFAHGRWSSVLLDRVVRVDCSSDSPQIFAPHKYLVESFQRASFTARLLPYLRGSGMSWPDLKRGDLVRYRLLATDEEGAEGVAVELEPFLP